MNRVILGLVLVGFLVLVVPNPGVELVAAENPSASSVYAGDAVASATVGAGTRCFRLGLASGGGACTASHQAGWEVAPGGSAIIYYLTGISGTSPPGPPSGDADDLCEIKQKEETSTTTLHAFRNAVTCPTSGTSYTFYCTSDGTSSGTPVSGTFRLYLRVLEKTAGVTIYDVNSDSGTGHAQGAIRCGTTIASASTSAYPTGSTFAYTVAGENIAWTIGVSSSNTAQLRTYKVEVRDSSGSLPSGLTIATATQTAATTSLTTANLPVSDSWPAASDNYGIRISPTGNSALTGVKWTHIHSATSPVVRTDDTYAYRPTFYNVDPRVTATHLLQVNNAAFATPPMSLDAGVTRTSSDIGYYATRFTNARGEGMTGAGFQFSRSLQDTAAMLPADTASGLSVVTQGGQAGWSANLFLWTAGTPLGSWTKTVDVTGPASIDANTHLIDSSIIYTLVAPASGFTGDPLRLLCGPLIANPGETVTCAAAESNADGSARTGNAAGTLYDLWNPSNTQIVTGGATTEIGSTGIYRFTYTPGGSPTLGNYIAIVRTTDASPVTTSTVFTIETDPTIALASSLATALSDLGLVKGYTDTVEASLSTAATAHGTLQADTDDLQSSATHADGHHHAQDTAIAGVDDLVNGHTDGALTVLGEHFDERIDDIIVGNVTVYDAYGALILENVTHVHDDLEAHNATAGNNATLGAILLDFQQHDLNQSAHRDNPLEFLDMTTMTFADYLISLTWTIALVWALRARPRPYLLLAAAATIGLLLVFIDLPTISMVAAVLLAGIAIWLEAIVGERVYERLFGAPAGSTTGQ